MANDLTIAVILGQDVVAHVAKGLDALAFQFGLMPASACSSQASRMSRLCWRMMPLHCARSFFADFGVLQAAEPVECRGRIAREPFSGNHADPRLAGRAGRKSGDP